MLRDSASRKLFPYKEWVLFNFSSLFRVFCVLPQDYSLASFARDPWGKLIKRKSRPSDAEWILFLFFTFILFPWQDYSLASFAHDPWGKLIKRKSRPCCAWLRALFFPMLQKAGFLRQEKTKPGTFVPGFFFCRGGRIRTCDPLVPNQMR